ncbi:ABC transporter ATP-binding protein [Xaviernesmea oryzae]|uniref:ABC transporter ATP-binding protein n=1 Tax=Xaviernesmea oryzae TaxID=464029 RepID=A0A1Q9AVZ7_9HYPH|nr:ABC transporter ATP-binding protein [Xaviernesmea oryzae]OLP59619.1 ABC transporter ATP-binding protein [Xaviernesmea oryzae]SEM24668.1 multiple sugar transport system ATP-binding protein [Xaviernesmea oryzae]
MAHVELANVDKYYGHYHALRGIDLSVDKGEFIVMVGPSGCGKSTTLKTIAGLESISSGRIVINGRDVTREEPGDRGIAMVFQSYALYPHMTVAENMGFGLRMQKRPKAEIDQAVLRAAEILRLTDQLDKRPKALSGGQRQRVAIGRAITRSPEVFLFDEPLSNLDAALRTQMRVELSTLHERLGSTMIYVTHDQVEAMTMASRIVVFNKGIVEQVGAPLELYANPVNLFVAGFLGAPRMNFVSVRLGRIVDGTAEVAVDGGPTFQVPVVADLPTMPPGATLTLGIRPENIVLRPASAGTVPATIRLVEQLGRETILYVDAGLLKASSSESGTANLTVQTAEPRPLHTGEAIHLSLPENALFLFAPDGRRISRARPVFS